MSPGEIEFFQSELSKEPIDRVLSALGQLAREPIPAGKPPMPELGVILDYVHKRGSYRPTELLNTPMETLADLAARNNADPTYNPPLPERLRMKTDAEKLEEAGW